MSPEVALSIIGGLLGVGLICLGIYFYSWLAPYRRLLNQAGKADRESYSGKRKGRHWEIVVRRGQGSEVEVVAEESLGWFLFHQAMGEVGGSEVERMAAAVVVELGLDVSQPWGLPKGRTLVCERALTDSFFWTRREILGMCKGLLNNDLVLKAQRAQGRIIDP